jgi:acyl-CoA synthetase (NDP forming)
VTAEAREKVGLEVPVLGEEARREILEHVHEFSPAPLNPLDLIARKWHVDYAAASEILAKQEIIDGLIIVPPYGDFRRTSPVETMKGLVECCASLADIPRKYEKSVLAFAMREYENTATHEILKRGEIPFFESPETCARAMKVLCDYGGFRRGRKTR